MEDNIKVINIIPTDYEGNPRDALGYAWTNINKRIPGEDIILDHHPENGILWRDYLKSRYGNIEIHSHNHYGWLKDTPGEIIAYVNCMWCGGISGDVYRPYPNTTPPKDFNHDQPGDTLVETTATERMLDKIELAEQDKRYKNHPGYCTKCHSFCYGDCDA